MPPGEEKAPQSPPGDLLPGLLVKLDEATHDLTNTLPLAKPAKVARVFDIARRVIMQTGGCAAIEARAQALENAGVFLGSDWANPQTLIPSFAGSALRSHEPNTVVIEALSELRLLAIARGEFVHPHVGPEQAHHYLTQVLALNLSMLFTPLSEADRARQGRLAQVPRAVLRHLSEEVGYEHVIDRLIDEIWRFLRQRPIQTDAIKAMITQISLCRANPDIDLGASGQGAERLVSSLYGPTEASRDDPGVEAYRARLAELDTLGLQAEAMGSARAMHDTGLVSDYHAVLLRYLMDEAEPLIGDALGLSTTGRDALLCYRDLVLTLIDAAVHPTAAQTVFGLAQTLERGVLYHPAVAPALWRQLSMKLSEWSTQRLIAAYGDTIPPQTRLLEGVLAMLGLPLGVGQGNNPTCQAARALSMWSHSDPDYLLQLVAWAARDDEIVMHFEGKRISSKALFTSGRPLPFDLDPVSLLVVPHLDFIYAEMGRLCAGREGDPHRWINPEFHGWWVGRGFYINVDVATGNLRDLDQFLRCFYAYYHPFFNGNQPMIHPQPAGIAVTDSAGRFIGWHAISIHRVALDPSAEMRVYFYNPNNDSGQDWGDGVQVSTAGKGERYGEASLPFEQFASRLYIFHYDPPELGEPASVDREALGRIVQAIYRTWGRDRMGLASAPPPDA